MADKFERGTQQWVGAEPEVTLPSAAKLEAIAQEEVNDEARHLRAIERADGHSAAASRFFGDVVVVVETGNPANVAGQSAPHSDPDTAA